MKETLKWNISRDSPTDKLRDFLEWGRDIQKDIQYQVTIYNKYAIEQGNGDMYRKKFAVIGLLRCSYWESQSTCFTFFEFN